MMANSCFQKIIYREMSLSQRSSVTDKIIQMLSENTSEIKKILLDGIANGSFENVDVEMLIATMFGTKSYIINSSQMASFLIGKDTADPKILEEEVKPRLKSHLKKMFKAYLTKHHE